MLCKWTITHRLATMQKGLFAPKARRELCACVGAVATVIPGPIGRSVSLPLCKRHVRTLQKRKKSAGISQLPLFEGPLESISS